MKIKAQELSGAALDFAVAKSESIPVKYWCNEGPADAGAMILVTEIKSQFPSFYAPSTNWSQGGPIIEREDISFRKYHRPDAQNHGTYYAMVCRESGQVIQWSKRRSSQGPTPLIAAMRCYVSSKLGEEIDVPEELV